MKSGTILAAAAAALLLPTLSSAVEIRVLASGATRDAYVEAVPQFEKATGHTVVTTWTGSANIKKRIAAGEVYDLVIVGAPVIDAFVQQGKVVAGSRVDLMKSGVGVGVRAGASRPDISSSGNLKKAVLEAKSIGYSTGPSGDYVIKLLERMGIADQVRPKLKQVPSGERIGTFISSGEAEIGFQQVSELIDAPGVDYLGPLPPEVQQTTVFSAGIHSGAKEAKAAKELVEFLTGPAAASAIRKHGMEPG